MAEEFPCVARHPDAWSPSDLAAFVDLVGRGGEVEGGLLGRAKAAKAIAMIFDGETPLGTAGLKNPNLGYRAGVFGKAAAQEQATDFPFELGWVFVDPAARGQGLSKKLIDAALETAGVSGVYATTRETNHAMHSVLLARGFFVSGNPYASGQHEGENILLLVRKGRQADKAPA